MAMAQNSVVQMVSKNVAFWVSEILKDPFLGDVDHDFGAIMSHTDHLPLRTYPISKAAFKGIAEIMQRFLRETILLAHLSCLGCCHFVIV
jgi:hypothetical protein